MTVLSRLRLLNFRNHAALDLHLDGGPVCLFGANGAGKTNILEALSLLGPGRGLRSAPLGDLSRHGGADPWTIAATLQNDQKIGVGLEADGRSAKRRVRIDGAPATTGDLAERIRIVWLTPAMDGVFRGGASDRRRFFDRQVMAHMPDHGRLSAEYERAMRERNALLERDRVDPAWADALEARMALAGAEIIVNRQIVLDRLQASVNERPDGFFPKADLVLEGALEPLAREGRSVADVESELRATFMSGRPRDRAAGRALSGPHRTDLGVVHRPSGAPAAQASTGQQKALLIGLILANARALGDTGSGPVPLILLDEAAAHLDTRRRAALFDELSSLGGQAWLTGTEAALFEAFADRAQLIEVCERPEDGDHGRY
jgi:DNA replication and repair protein RecF